MVINITLKTQKILTYLEKVLRRFRYFNMSMSHLNDTPYTKQLLIFNRCHLNRTPFNYAASEREHFYQKMNDALKAIRNITVFGR